VRQAFWFSAVLIVGLAQGATIAGAEDIAPVQSAATGVGEVLTPQAINAAKLSAIPAVYAPSAGATTIRYLPATPPSKGWPSIDYVAGRQPPSAAVARMEVLLDRAGASPGVIDGYDGENLRKAVSAIEIMQGAKPDGRISAPLLQALEGLEDGKGVIGSYVIAEADVAAIVPPIPKDYGEMAKLSLLGYTSVAEELAERFHMDQKFFEALNPGAKFVAGETVYGAITGADRKGKVARIEADKAARQVRAYDVDGKLLVAYPATIGSKATPSPTGSFTVVAVAENPTYTYNPDLNFKQGNNDKVLTIPPGPNGPVGSVWIALSQPTFGIHGTPEPSLIDKAASHGCVRLTNWDAEELAKMVSKGVTVDFLP
jgi:lipoprotein-anchoring transpeptidase ErfK/SrfK